MRKVLGITLTLIAALLAVLAGVGAAVLFTRTYRFVEYSAVITLVSAAASWTLFRIARNQFRT